MKKKRLLWQVFPPYLLLIMLSLFSITIYMSGFIRDYSLNMTRDDLTSRAYLLEHDIQSNLSDMNQLNDYCRQTGEKSGTRITVIRANGIVMADSNENYKDMVNHNDRPEVIKALKGDIGTIIRFSDTLSQNMMYVAVPVIKNNMTIIIVRTAVPITQIDSQINHLRMKIAFAGILITLMASLVSLFISKKISRPIEEMTSSASHFAEGNLTYRLPIQENEEMAGLADAMNIMAEKLNSRINEQARQHSELEAILLSMIEGVIALDCDERVLKVNRAARMILNIKVLKVKGKSILELVRNRELESFVLKADESDISIEKDIVIKMGSDKILNIRSSALRDSEERRIGTLIILNDVTKLRKLDQIKQDFVANVSHELKTPMTSIKGFVETLISMPDIDKDENDRFLNVIEKNANRLISIVEDLLNLSKIEEIDKENNLDYTVTDINEIITSVIDALKIKADDKNIQVIYLKKKNFEVFADSQLLEQAVLNLLDNALKYSEEKTEITISVNNEERDIMIKVMDQGAGIEQEHHERLFERFYRVDKGRSRKLGGTGLGLAIVKHICKAHGGNVSVVSSPGKGSEFTLIIPDRIS